MKKLETGVIISRGLLERKIYTSGGVTSAEDVKSVLKNGYLSCGVLTPQKTQRRLVSWNDPYLKEHPFNVCR